MKEKVTPKRYMIKYQQESKGGHGDENKKYIGQW